jgi:hypothetical protein
VVVEFGHGLSALPGAEASILLSYYRSAEALRRPKALYSARSIPTQAKKGLSGIPVLESFTFANSSSTLEGS